MKERKEIFLTRSAFILTAPSILSAASFFLAASLSSLSFDSKNLWAFKARRRRSLDKSLTQDERLSLNYTK